jgi:release factor glutamine methyltransferase
VERESPVMNMKYRNACVNTTQQVYEPSEDSFLLAETALSEIKDSEKVIEVGCGSGIISAVIKANKKVSIIGVDINPFAVECSKKNGVEVIMGDLLTCIKGKFDTIVFNPPYLPTCEKERTNDWLGTALDGGENGRMIIYRFIRDAGKRLAENGKILMVVSSLTGIEEIKSEFYSLGYEVRDGSQERISFEQITVLIATRCKN